MDGITIDLSKAIFIFSFNDRNKVCPILLDRMEIINFHSYSRQDKKYIAEKYLLPKIVKQYFGDENKIKIEFEKHNKKQILNKIISTNTLQKTKHKYNNKKISGSKMLNIHYIMKRRLNILKKNRTCGGVRYIKRNLERIISRINIERLERLDHNHEINSEINSEINKIIIDDKI
jgi:hypothetical protein